MWWLAVAAYVTIGIYLTPRFAKASYEGQKARWRYQPEQESLATGALLGWMKSWIWPVWLVVDIAVQRITADQRAAEAEKELAKTVQGAKAVIARYEADEKRKWDSTFRNGGTL